MLSTRSVKLRLIGLLVFGTSATLNAQETVPPTQRRLNLPGGGTSAAVTLESVRSLNSMLTGVAAHPETYTVLKESAASELLGMEPVHGAFRADFFRCPGIISPFLRLSLCS